MIKKAPIRGSKSKSDELTDKQRLFAISYASNGNITKASEVAGVHRKTGENYLAKAAVNNFLQELAKVGGDKIATATQLQEYATNILFNDEEMYEEHPNFQTGGIIRTKISWATKQKWFDSLNKMQGNYQTIIDVNHNHYKPLEEVKKTGFRLSDEKVIEIDDFEWKEVDEEGDDE